MKTAVLQAIYYTITNCFLHQVFPSYKSVLIQSTYNNEKCIIVNCKFYILKREKFLCCWNCFKNETNKSGCKLSGPLIKERGLQDFNYRMIFVLYQMLLFLHT